MAIWKNNDEWHKSYAFCEDASVDVQTWQFLCDEILSMELRREPVNAGHEGKGYKGGWIHDFSMARVWEDVNVRGMYPTLCKSIECLETCLPHFSVRQVMVNCLHAGGILDWHRDKSATGYRFHLPVITNSDVWWIDEFYGMGEKFHMRRGLWYGPMPYGGVLHKTINDGKDDRYHVVVDMIPPE